MFFEARFQNPPNRKNYKQNPDNPSFQKQTHIFILHDFLRRTHHSRLKHRLSRSAKPHAKYHRLKILLPSLQSCPRNLHPRIRRLRHIPIKRRLLRRARLLYINNPERQMIQNFRHPRPICITCRTHLRHNPLRIQRKQKRGDSHPPTHHHFFHQLLFPYPQKPRHKHHRYNKCINRPPRKRQEQRCYKDERQ